ncbi:hypothetical protein UK82_07235 [Frankia sp. ACN1ag]|nr:hypothetical protein UK82_07235 [Frankia sp. ACN1ag]
MALLVAVAAAGCGSRAHDPRDVQPMRSAEAIQRTPAPPSPTPVLDAKAGDACTLVDAVVGSRAAPGWSGDPSERFGAWSAMFTGWLQAQTAAMESENEEIKQMALSWVGEHNQAPPSTPDSAANPGQVEQLVSWCLAHGFAQPHSRSGST